MGGRANNGDVVLAASVVGGDGIELVFMVALAWEVGAWNVSVRLLLHTPVCWNRGGNDVLTTGLERVGVGIVNVSASVLCKEDMVRYSSTRGALWEHCKRTRVELAADGIGPLHFHVCHSRASCAEGGEEVDTGTHVCLSGIKRSVREYQTLKECLEKKKGVKEGVSEVFELLLLF